MEFPGVVNQDKYRNHLSGEGEKDTKWKFAVPPNYDVVNKLSEEGYMASQNLVKTGNGGIYPVRLISMTKIHLIQRQASIRTTFEVLHVYSGLPVIVFKFRHWGTIISQVENLLSSVEYQC